MERADAVFPGAASALARGRRLRRAAGAGLRARRRTMPVTFAEIKEVDEESAEVCECSGVGRARKLDELGGRAAGGERRARLGESTARRSAERCVREVSPPAPDPPRAASEPAPATHT